MLGNFVYILFCRLLIFISKLTFSKKIFQGYHQSVKQFDPNQAKHFVGPDLGSNCLQTALVGKELKI